MVMISPPLCSQSWHTLDNYFAASFRVKVGCIAFKSAEECSFPNGVESLRSRAEDDAGCGAVGVELPFSVENFSFSRRSPAAHVNNVRFATDHARLGGHWPELNEPRSP